MPTANSSSEFILRAFVRFFGRVRWLASRCPPINWPRYALAVLGNVPGGDRRIDGTNHLLSETFASQGDHRDIAVDTFGSPEVETLPSLPRGTSCRRSFARPGRGLRDLAGWGELARKDLRRRRILERFRLRGCPSPPDTRERGQSVMAANRTGVLALSKWSVSCMMTLNIPMELLPIGTTESSRTATDRVPSSKVCHPFGGS